jgi:hypothetical protein
MVVRDPKTDPLYIAYATIRETPVAQPRAGLCTFDLRGGKLKRARKWRNWQTHQT